MVRLTKWSFWSGALLVALAASAPALAQQWPSRTLTINTATAPGGSSDTIGRLMANRLSERLKVPVIIQYNPSAAGVAAYARVAQAPGDGYTALIVNVSASIQAALRNDLEFDITRDYAPVGTFVTYPLVMSVRPDSPIRSLAELIARVKSMPPRTFTYVITSIGSAHHLLGEWINLEAGIEMQSVPYRGAATQILDVAGGRVDLMVEPLTTGLARVQSGQLRGLAVSSLKRHASLPDVPAVAELLPAVSMDSWSGLVMPRSTPRPIIDRLNAELRAILSAQDVRDQLAKLGNTVMISTPEEVQARILREVAVFRQVVNAKGIKPE